MTGTGSVRYKLLLHTLASSIPVYIYYLRTAEQNVIPPDEHWRYMVVALIVGGIQTAMLVGRCAVIDWWIRRNSLEKLKRHTFLYYHADLVTGAVLVGTVGWVLVYDGWWMIEPHLPYLVLNLLWLVVLGIIGTAVFVYLGVFYLQIGQVYDLSRRQQITALAVSLLPEIILVGLAFVAWLWFIITFIAPIAE